MCINYIHMYVSCMSGCFLQVVCVSQVDAESATVAVLVTRVAQVCRFHALYTVSTMEGVPREQKMLQGQLPSVVHHQVCKYAKKITTQCADF